MQSAKTKHTAECSLAAPAATGSDGNGPRDVVLVVVHDQSQGSVQKVFNEFSEPGVAADEAFGTADDVVAVREETGYVGGRVGNHV